MPEGASATGDTIYTRRAEYHDPANAFAFQWSRVPRRQFLDERDRALDPATGTAEILLDSSDALEIDYPATTPTLLCRYIRLAAGGRHASRYAASGEIYYAMSGAGESRNGGDRIAWAAGDIFCFPGGGETRHEAGGEDALLFMVTNEPLLSFERLRAPEKAVIETVHYPAAEIARRLEAVFARERSAREAGRAILFSSPALAGCTNMLPSINVAINTLEPGGDQRPHRHNGVAVTLAIQGEGVYSMIEDQRIDWSTGAAMITPPAELHAHHNRGGARMVSLVIQDEALHYYTRTPGFSWD
jgi:gentisate 1,2-dioxygenase